MTAHLSKCISLFVLLSGLWLKVFSQSDMSLSQYLGQTTIAAGTSITLKNGFTIAQGQTCRFYIDASLNNPGSGGGGIIPNPGGGSGGGNTGGGTSPGNTIAGLPKGSCGIQYTYDAAGNMTDREYVCNNASGAASVKETKLAVQKMSVSVQAVDVLYPNPTTGRFTLRMLKPLKNAQIVIMDMQGRIVERRTAGGNALQFDLSRHASGMYILHIRDEGETFTAKVVKQ